MSESRNSASLRYSSHFALVTMSRNVQHNHHAKRSKRSDLQRLGVISVLFAWLVLMGIGIGSVLSSTIERNPQPRPRRYRRTNPAPMSQISWLRSGSNSTPGQALSPSERRTRLKARASRTWQPRHPQSLKNRFLNRQERGAAHPHNRAAPSSA